ncbi:hypothetical protein OUZ56_029175 [Daphnia magna]|uniref:CxC3 like cysteine cluster domain-containing protein n=2 Tax=Daphnia magna TaxID=35525 RepID=A0ABR0B615_9CRUS|nr:hypothetical protein OUZ56_029175 [Daphnia magna]
MNEFESRPLLTHEFYGVENRSINIGMRVFVPVRCRTEKCKKLGTKGTLVLVAGTKYCTVISGEGRFDLHCAAFKCSHCDGVMNAELEDYIGSGYWPGNPKTLGVFFTTSFLKLYFHLKNYLPGSSEYGLLKALGAFSADEGREHTISNAFSRASRMYYYVTHLVDRDIKKKRKLSCRACSNKCCAVHIDGNHKLVRRKSKLNQEELEKIATVVGKLKNKIKMDSVCGNSDFKAAKEVSTNRKNLATTGSVMMCCVHGCLLKGVDMTKGETYSHTLLLLEHIYGLQDADHANLFIVQDVSCKLDPWLKELARLDPGRFKALYEKTNFHLSRLHGQAHVWYCRVLNFGHWKEGACATLGEELEQLFSFFFSVWKLYEIHERSKQEFLTEAAYHWNQRKEHKMAYFITQKFVTALSRGDFYKKRLTSILAEQKTSIEDLPSILVDIQDEARDYLKNHTQAASHLTDKQMELEKAYFELLNIKDIIACVAQSCKWRTKLRRTQTRLRAKAKALIVEINEIIAAMPKEKKIRPVNEKDFEAGIFPWDSNDHQKARSSYDKGEIIMMSHEVCRLKRLHADASSFERYYQEDEVQLGDGTLFTEPAESENDSGDEDVTDEDVTDEDVIDDEEVED